MLGLRIALLLPLLAATLWAAPLTKYDQRQDGDLNAHIHLENFVILLIPGGLRGFNIAAKVAPGRKHLARPAHAHAHAQGAEAEAAGDVPGEAPAHGLKAPPYHVDIDASRRPPPLMLEITPGAAGDEQHEVVIAESPAVLLPKRPSLPEEPQPPAEPESNGVPQGTVPPPPSTPAAAPAEAPKPPKADPTPTRVADKPKKPAAPAPAAPAADKQKRPVPAAAPAAAAAAPTPAPADKPKRPAPVPAADKPKRPVAAPAVVSPTPTVAAPAPVSVPAPSPVSALPEAAPEASEAETPAKPAPAPAQAGGDRAARVAVLGAGLEASPAGGAPCAHGGCVHAQDPVGVYEDSLLKALSFGLEPAH